MPRKKNKSGCRQAVIICGILAGISLLVCGGGLYVFKDAIAELFMKVNDDPKQAAQLATTIFDGDFGESMKASSMVVNLPSLGRFMTFVRFSNENTGERIVIGQMDPAFARGRTPQEVEAQMSKSVGNQSEIHELTTLIAARREVNVRGQPRQFSFAKVKNTDGKFKGTESRVARGPFTGKGGPAYVIVVVPATSYSEGELAQLIEKMQ